MHGLSFSPSRRFTSSLGCSGGLGRNTLALPEQSTSIKAEPLICSALLPNTAGQSIPKEHVYSNQARAS